MSIKFYHRKPLKCLSISKVLHVFIVFFIVLVLVLVNLLLMYLSLIKQFLSNHFLILLQFYGTLYQLILEPLYLLIILNVCVKTMCYLQILATDRILYAFQLSTLYVINAIFVRGPYSLQIIGLLSRNNVLNK